jgi:2-hydroxychromene-2-carboxylate isomerase
MAGTILFYFDFVSPFSYLAYQRLPGLAARHGYGLDCRVIDLMQAKLLAGNTGPSSRDQPLKRRYNQFDKERWARRYGVPIVNPKTHDSRLLNRGAFLAAERRRLPDYIAYAWRKIWGEGGDMTDDGLLADVARAMGWDAAVFIAFTRSPAADELLKAATLLAHARGVFGVPTMMIGDEMWWGNDRLDFLEEFLRAPAPHLA